MKKYTIIFCLLFSALVTRCEWKEVANALHAPLPHARLIKIVIGTQDSIWSLWNVCTNNCRHAIAQWNGTEWELLHIPFALKEVVDIAVTPQGQLYILEDYDRKALQYAQTRNPGRSLYDLLSDKRYKIPQRLHIYDGFALKTRNISNTTACRLNTGTANAIYLKTLMPTICYCMNDAMCVEEIPYHYVSVISQGTQMFYQCIDKVHDKVSFRTRDRELFAMNLNSAGIINTYLPWQVTTTHLLVSLQTKVGTTIVLATDLSTLETTSLPYVPCKLKSSNGLINHHQISLGYDNTIWAHGCNNVMYEWVS